MDLVAVSDLSKWRETLALLSTYGKNEVQYSTVLNRTELNVMNCMGLWVVFLCDDMTSFTSTIEIVFFSVASYYFWILFYGGICNM